MKKFILSLLMSCAAAGAFAQDDGDIEDTDTAQAKTNHKSAFYSTPYRERNSGSFGRNRCEISLSYGFPNQLYWNGYYGSSYYNLDGGIGPIMLRAEVAVHDEIGVLAFAQGATKSWSNGGYKEDAFGMAFGAMGVYHFNKLIPVKTLDIYVGLGAEVEHRAISDNYYNYTSTDTYFGFAGVAGVRWMFCKPLGIFVEAGSTGFSYANAGITLNIVGRARRAKSDEAPKVGPGE